MECPYSGGLYEMRTSNPYNNSSLFWMLESKKEKKKSNKRKNSELVTLTVDDP